jgi:hypothetical protein
VDASRLRIVSIRFRISPTVCQTSFPARGCGQDIWNDALLHPGYVISHSPSSQKQKRMQKRKSGDGRIRTNITGQGGLLLEAAVQGAPTRLQRKDLSRFRIYAQYLTIKTTSPINAWL